MMAQSNVSTWLQFALQQMAAESYLDRSAGLTEILIDGNNDRRVISLDQFTGKTRFADLQAQQFVQRYQIVDHHANDATGFSATLMRDTATGEYTLSFRSTESVPAAEGGDRERDFFGADVEIGASGFAFGQLAAMEEYFTRLKQGIKSDGTVDASLQAFFSNPAHQLNVTGYSLGSHLATVFTELHASEVTQTYLFNGPGRGHVPGPVPGLLAEESRINDMLTYFRSVLDNPDNALLAFPRPHDLCALRHGSDRQWGADGECRFSKRAGGTTGCLTARVSRRYSAPLFCLDTKQMKVFSPRTAI